VCSSDLHMSCVVLPNNFWQMIRPFIPLDKDFEKAFVQTFALPEFRSIGSGGGKACSKMLSILATYKDVPEETSFKLLSNDILLDKLKNTKNESEFSEYVEAAIIEENNHLIEEKAALESQLEREKQANKNRAKEYNDKIKQIVKEKAQLEKSLKEIQDITEGGKKTVSIITAKEAEARKELNSQAQKVSKEIQKREKAEQHAFYTSITATIAVILVLIGAFEFCVYYFKWQWLINHPNSYGIQFAVDIAIATIVIAIMYKELRKWCFVLIVAPIIIVMISLLGGPKDIKHPTPASNKIVEDGNNARQVPNF
jgi:hypothetical protein